MSWGTRDAHYLYSLLRIGIGIGARPLFVEFDAMHQVEQDVPRLGRA
tara:strand:+ start:315 stop:455 length:141 start_codon:yes stop_codon:yes gene_type:complete